MFVYYICANITYVCVDSKFLRDTEWLMKSFEEGPREQTVLLTAPDVLEPSVLQKVRNLWAFDGDIGLNR